ncbi:DMT family transporter [Niveibacterium umoris]|uniref:Drug/metabolite transporter (DMT)-like permease n=1 Tax=Niveibacterium umoris TaxID=1193620 RepID=A0A840BNY8_9RHOO|nr:DMT family transporter [Niveibacterium umoris]MBB4013199.1 drug/metabolite transporter (DMT)-like permease [Niveibacterium umoris]
MNRPALTLICTAMFWAAIWWPFRWLLEHGLSTPLANTLAFGFGAVIALAWSRGRLPGFMRDPRLLVLALASAICNLGYNAAATHAPVMKVVLLLYTAPLWTVPLAWWLLRERPGLRGSVALALCVGGALLMLWHPALGYPWPASGWEWIGLAAGASFAVYNVLIRALPHGDEKERVALIFIVEFVLAGAWLLADGETLAAPGAAPLGMTAFVGIAMWGIIIAMQWGLQRLPANLAAVLMSTELVFAALFSWWWAGETLSARELTGALLVASAALISAWQPAEAPATA